MINPIAERFAKLSTERLMRQKRPEPVTRPQGPQPGMMYTGGTPFFNEQTGQYLPGHGPEAPQQRPLHTGGNPNFNEMPNQQDPRRQMQDRWRSKSGNMGLEQLLQLLAQYRLRGGF
ncbi:hypothetical protein [Phosphitispora fastidiosa]|uniref:hypothetical protein n=1 Tax=Phosphitispora fastidiosa TaxID=2837202 RepID=UPI001E2A8AB0|nr:hypothetical protein [Phosphitispora fastidiosa]MBU7006295.1 hypothetical protein [Phosphitispora fastidiosa]